jgi:hypothetical protein
MLALALVVSTGLYLVGLAAVSLLAPARAARFLLGFAGSALAHYLELLIRLLVGGAFVLHAPRMPFTSFFVLFGWVLIVTTVGLIAVPWRWHRRFARWSVPYALRSLKLVAIASLAFGLFVLAAVLRGG